ncbi:hypothetical protein RO1_21660 [Roseburia intestinalis XB6B4]|uniref:Uncharacterized protein n=2 Tax=Roseburia intestinalis TaxID=166486 RepID=C7G720_9FIRM|nr:hypothetical protein ROSINTL182_05687 [Roseburia intestinalis L1-82]CBL08118.1 hypothetical protein ROI_08960 [Roseburia intestinalis M50/1]CBL12679.1 hypothetical protein RO1_21660 [Roseburia intestinalis XB6B4]
MRGLFTHLDCADNDGLPFHEANMKRQFFCYFPLYDNFIFCGKTIRKMEVVI